MTTLSQLFQWGKQTLSGLSDTAAIDAEVLICHVLKCQRAYLYSHHDEIIPNQQIKQFHQLIERRKTGYPVAYLTGSQSFWTLELSVNEATLIPRPDTELLVELALQKIQTISKPKVLDLGTGSGAIALAIASERPDAQIIAIDNSLDALKQAKRNQQNYHLHHISFLCSHWFDALAQDELFDIIVSNPPYIAVADPHLKKDIQFEPHQALVSGQLGLDDIYEILSSALRHLQPNGWILLEHGYDQKVQVQALLEQNHFNGIHTWQDIAGNNRVSGGQKKVA